MKKVAIIAVGVFLATLLVGAQPAFAQTKQATGVQKQEQNVDNLKKKADQLIETRINSLNKLLQRMQGDKGLSADDQTFLSGEVRTNITNLTALKAKINSGTDINTVRADAKSIISKFKIFTIFEPRIRTLIMIGDLSALSAKTFSTTSKLQTLINTLKSQGKDVSTLQHLLDNINGDLAMINYKLAADKQSTRNSSTTSIFTTVRKDLGTVRSEFTLIKKDITQMRSAMNSIKSQKAVLPSANPAGK